MRADFSTPNAGDVLGRVLRPGADYLDAAVGIVCRSGGSAEAAWSDSLRLGLFSGRDPDRRWFWPSEEPTKSDPAAPGRRLSSPDDVGSVASLAADARGVEKAEGLAESLCRALMPWGGAEFRGVFWRFVGRREWGEARRHASPCLPREGRRSTPLCAAWDFLWRGMPKDVEREAHASVDRELVGRREDGVAVWAMSSVLQQRAWRGRGFAMPCPFDAIVAVWALGYAIDGIDDGGRVTVVCPRLDAGSAFAR